MAINRVELSTGEVLVDLSESTVTTEKLAVGVVALNAAGERITGTMQDGSVKPPTLGNAVFLGDSIGAGYGNPNAYGVAKALEATGAFGSFTNCAVSGSTLGPYQADSGAAGYDAAAQVTRYRTQIGAADIVFLEYGGNDETAVLAGKVTYMGVANQLDAVVSAIMAINSTAKIVYLFPGSWYSSALVTTTDAAGNYLGALLIETCHALNIQCIAMSECTVANHSNKDDMWQSDHRHPTPAMVDRIARHVVSAVRSDSTVRCSGSVPVVFSISGTAVANGYRFDVVSIRWLLSRGINVQMMVAMSASITLFGQIAFNNTSIGVQWLCTYNDSSGVKTAIVDLLNNGTVSVK